MNNQEQKTVARIQNNPNQQNNIKQMLNIFYNPTNKPDTKQTLDSLHNNRNSLLPPYKHNPNTQNQPIYQYHGSEGNSHNMSFLYILIVLACTILFVFFLYDLRAQYERASKQLQIKKVQCMRKYDENQCLNPVEILVEECKKLRSCYHDENTVKLTVVFARVLTHMMRTLVEEMGLICLVAVLIVIGFYFWGTGSNKAKINPIHAKSH